MTSDALPWGARSATVPVLRTFSVDAAYEPSPGSTVGIWLTGLDSYRAALDARRWEVPVLGPAVWVPQPERCRGAPGCSRSRTPSATPSG